MKNIVLFAFSLLCVTTFGQAIGARKAYLEESVEKGVYRHSYYLKSFTNVGPNEVEGIEQKVKDKLNTHPTEKLYWYDNPFYVSVSNEEDAQVVISATYNLNDCKTEQKAKTYSNRELPYTVQYTEHTSTAQVIATYTYTDGTPTFVDTIIVERSSNNLPWKKNRKTPEELDQKTRELLVTAIKRPSSPVDFKEVKILFPKVKIKDKALKEEYATVQGLLKNGQYAEAGLICRKVYESNKKSAEAAAALGLCYELVGNYPKAQEYMKQLKDFHMLSRMRKNMKVLDYARSIGYEPDFVEF